MLNTFFILVFPFLFYIYPEVILNHKTPSVKLYILFRSPFITDLFSSKNFRFSFSLSIVPCISEFFNRLWHFVQCLIVFIHFIIAATLKGIGSPMPFKMPFNCKTNCKFCILNIRVFFSENTNRYYIRYFLDRLFAVML